MSPAEFFLHCPRCAVRIPDSTLSGSNPFDCAACGFRYYFNPAAAVAVFITRPDGRVLLIRRAKEPAQGRLAPAGGFIDIGERAEDAVGREIAEELGIRLENVRFLCSQPNRYEFRGVTYPVLDLFFTATTPDTELDPDPGEVSSADWHDPNSVCEADLAFPSMQAAWRTWRPGLR